MPLEWQLYLPREWPDEPDRCRRAGVPDDMLHQEKGRLALGLLDTLAQWRLTAPVADAGYGVSTPLRLGLKERGLSYALALNGNFRCRRGGLTRCTGGRELCTVTGRWLPDQRL
ncbi:transposase [Streptomyces sp. NPDC017991]|uniref:transposase n=1 Tax=Streptomyces sp. NPDC017991 TaxID=3365026 RepID=UPI0037A305CB